MERYNPNYVGGDINGGAGHAAADRAAAHPAVEPVPDRAAAACTCAPASTPPGGGVHGMCGQNAAQVALADHFS